ncbi:HNH endonuclease signature motif containing protein [Haloprofundus halobius]|uniref:HNH endonuclease signature motif containing protein n=1 Tax=Haloprofundus halobius TaxID=2876194 RepID=UPI001CC9D974|nr:HNH endonuclease signature motif containing protein [Haloprofundus halobius]
MQGGDGETRAGIEAGGIEGDDERCTVCGATDRLRVHHIDGSRQNTRAENLVRMCTDCHRNVDTESNGTETWHDHDVALPDEMSRVVGREFVRLVCECRRDLGWRPDRTRHYYPLVVADGIFAATRMDAKSFESRLVELGLR